MTTQVDYGLVPKQGESPLNAETILHQAYETILPVGRWTKDMYIDYDNVEDVKTSSRVCSMGALLLVEHIEAHRALSVHLGYDDDTDEPTVTDEGESWVAGPQDPDYDDEGELAEAAVGLLIDRDPEFAKATKLLAQAVNELFPERGGESGDNEMNIVIKWNDHEDTTWEDVKSVFQLAIEKARQA